MRYLTVAEVLLIHDIQITLHGGIHGIISVPLLESAVKRPETNISGKDMFASIYEKAAILTYSIIKNHPFADGNKRTAIFSAIAFLELNQQIVSIKKQSIKNIALDIAKGKLSVKEIAKYFKENSRPFKTSKR